VCALCPQLKNFANNGLKIMNNAELSFP